LDSTTRLDFSQDWKYENHSRTIEKFGEARAFAAHFFVIPLLLAWLALLPRVQAVIPPPDGGYLGGNTAEGDAALHNLTSGVWNTALGRWRSITTLMAERTRRPGFKPFFTTQLATRTPPTAASAL
jgi:hypothetical protein